MTERPPPQSEIEELRARLEEAQEMLRAIRSGEVDAVVIQGPAGEQVYTLKGAEEPYRTMVEEMTEGAITLSPEGIILYCNARFAELVKEPLKNLTGSKLSRFFSPQELSAFTSLLARGREAPLRCELTLQTSDGTRVAVLVSTRPLMDDSLLGIAAVVTDLTPVLQATEALRESDEKFRYLFEHSPVGKSMTFLTGGMQVNPAFCDMLGYSREEFEKLRWQDITHPDDLELSQEEVDLVVAGKKDFMHIVKRYLHKNGSVVWADLSASLRRDTEGKPLYFLANVVDITERKRAEEESQLSHERLRMIAETIQDVFWISTPGVSKMLYISPAYERLWERSCESLYREPKSFLDAVHPDDRPGFVPIIELHRQGHPYETEYRIVQRNGKVRWIRERGFPVRDADGQLKAMTGICTDITELKNTQEELKQYRQHLEELVQERTKALSESEERYRHEAAELAAANVKLHELDQLKSMFIASMSHELRTPLNSVIGFTGVILQGIAGPITEEQRKQLNIVKESAAHLLQLINDVIDVSKIEADKAEVSIGEFDLPELVREVATSFAIMAQKKGVELAVDAPNRLRITSDRRRVNQILVNLLGNAVKFTDSGRIELRVGAGIDGVQIEVRDTGIGIGREDMSKLFGAFSQIVVDGRPREGSGLGLYLSQKMAHLLGGHIAAQSESGKGSVFTLSLPANFRSPDA
ncbi:MAG TPA: PAS domain S-box protein [Gallionella sp.]|nr:PAS domain S-box protein [Gallionella sp.]